MHQNVISEAVDVHAALKTHIQYIEKCKVFVWNYFLFEFEIFPKHFQKNMSHEKIGSPVLTYQKSSVGHAAWSIANFKHV
jgi:hypothetical protein